MRAEVRGAGRLQNTNVSYFEDYVYPLAGSMQNSTVLGGNYRYEYFKQVVRVEPMTLTAGQLDFGFNSEQGGEVFLALFTFLYVDLLDTTGTLFAMATFAGLVDEEGGFEGDTKAFLVDGSRHRKHHGAPTCPGLNCPDCPWLPPA